VGLFRGFLAPFRGAIYLARERMWRHLLAPIVVNLALGAGTLIAAARYWHRDLAELLAKSPVIGWIFVGVMTLLGGVVLFILLQPLMNAIFCDLLAEKVEKRVRGSAPSAPLLPSIGKSLVHGLLKLVLYAIAMGLGLALTVTPLTGLGALVGIGLGAVFLAYDGFDYALSRRGTTFGGKWAYLAKHPGLALGFGLGSYVLYLVPLAFLVAPPFAAVGATLAYLEDDTRAAARASGPRGGKAPAGEKKPGDSAIPEAHNPIDISAS
jgi:CysZ protein